MSFEEVFMKKSVVITTDSVCDLPQDLLQRFQVQMIPLTVTEGEHSYKDGAGITPDDIYRIYDEQKILPKTSAISPQEFTDFFTPILAEGSEVVHIDISAACSASYQNACIAAGELEGVYPVDSKHLTAGQGLLVIEACRLRDEGLSAREIAERLTDARERIFTSFVVDTLEFLWKGGRCSGLTALGANLLQVHPCLELREGEIKVARKYRGAMPKVYAQYIRDALGREGIDLRMGFLVHSGRIPQEELEQLRREILERVPFAELPIVQVGCTVTSHAGPGAMGVIFAMK